MPELETEKAIAARVKQAIFFFKIGKPKDGLEILERLEKILPEPDPRHSKATHAAIEQAAVKTLCENFEEIRARFL